VKLRAQDPAREERILTNVYVDRWKSAVQTLATFHKVDYTSPTIKLSSFGRHSNFYDRQIKTFSVLSPDQAGAVDVETNIPVGPIPYFDEMTSFFKDKSRQPKDRSTLIHGDYKIDNLVFHKTEPRVIGILDWEMATIGHPLSDLVNLTGPWSWTATTSQSPKGNSDEFKPGVTPGLPSLEQVVQWYSEASGYDAAKDLQWGNAFGGYRGAVIMQGIAARYARRQASGITAKNYAAQMKPYGVWAWTQVQEVKRRQDEERGGGKALAKL
jgi:aminoglycoside phosphotransferase (APT) family kinase protein